MRTRQQSARNSKRWRVTAAHVVRYLIVVLFTIPMYRLLEAARTWKAGGTQD